MTPHHVLVKSGSAITVLNAIRSNYGAAIGTSIFTPVVISPSESLEIHVPANTGGTDLIKRCVDSFSLRTGVNVTDVRIETSMILPPARGLKTSSAVSTATIAALSLYYNSPLSRHEVVRLSAEASINSGVSITGAYDDAYASLIGGFAITETSSGKLVQYHALQQNTSVYLLIPVSSNPKKQVGRKLADIDLSLIKKAVKAAFDGDITRAIQHNTSAYGPVLSDYDLVKQLGEYAEIVGLNGAGPSLFLLQPNVPPDELRKIVPKYDVFPTNLR